MPRRQSPDAPPPEPPATLIAAGPSIPRRVRSLLPARRREAVAAASFPAGSRAPDPIPPERPCSPTAGALLLAGPARDHRDFVALEDPAQPRHARTASGRGELRQTRRQPLPLPPVAANVSRHPDARLRSSLTPSAPVSPHTQHANARLCPPDSVASMSAFVCVDDFVQHRARALAVIFQLCYGST
jgi:hypothetical protein